MNLNEKYFAAASVQLESRRAGNKLIEQQRRNEVYAKIPEFAMLEKSLSDTAAKIVPTIMSGGSDLNEKLEKLRQENLGIQSAMEQLLVSHGYSKDYLEPVYTCTKCGDKGFVDGGWCECFTRLVHAAAAEELNKQSPLEPCGFDSFRLDLYPDAADPNLGVSQNAVMTQNFNMCRDFAESFDGSGDGIFMIGGTGLGKTHLSLAIANRVIHRGFSVIYGSVPELLRTLEREQFGKADGDTMSLLMSCDLLILDDLGAEISSERNVSQLYEIINARMNRSKPLISSTNLTAQQLKQRYHDRIWSRLFSGKVMMFCGNDNRLKLSKKQKP